MLCESRYIESEKQMKKFKGLKRFSLSAKVVEDEIYYFRSVASFLITAEVIQRKIKLDLHRKQTLVYSDCLFSVTKLNIGLMLLVNSVRKLIVPQKEPSPLLDKKIEELEAKFADMTDEELEDLGDDDGDGSDAHCMPQLQTQLTSDMDMLHYAPPQVCCC